MGERDQQDGSDGLNDPQRRAVEWDQGPLIVLAGPGTGKTRVITRRVAHLIAQRGVPPESIVAATFTVKAAKELRRRVAELCGAEVADRVNAGTLHGLGYRLIRRFGDMIGLRPPRADEGPVIMDSAQRKRLLRAIIGDNGLYSWLPAPAREEMVGLAGWYLARFGEHAREPEDVLAFAEQWGARLERGVSASGELPDAEALEAERQEQRVFAETARLSNFYDQACRRKEWLSHDDLILLAARILRRSPRAAAAVRNEIRHVVVDEFQDVNAAQIELLRLIAPPESHAGRPDIVAVGDDDQAIYAFRGADDRAFARFASIWTAHNVIPLEHNYRSASRIVGACNEIISRAGQRFAPGKRVIAADASRGEGLVQCIDLQDASEDAEAALALILQDRAETAPPARGCAVICRNNADVERIGEFLRLEGLPVRVTRRLAPSEDPGVMDLLAWIELLADPDAVWAASRLVRRPPALVPASHLWQWDQLWRARRVARPAAPSSGAGAAYIEFIAARAAEVSGEITQRLHRLLAIHAELAQQAATLDAAAMIDRIIGAADLAHADLLPRRERARRIDNLVAVIAFARSRTPLLDPPRDLRALWSYYNDLETDDEREFRAKWNRGIDADEIDDESSDADASDGPDADSPSDPDAVHVLTAHAAKGLEFDTVFVPKVQPDHGYGRTRSDDRRLPVGFIPDPPARPGADDAPVSPPGSKDRQRDEERRIFYVACSRAHRRLVLMARKSKGLSTSTHFLQELTRPRVSEWVNEVIPISEVRSRAAAVGIAPAAARVFHELAPRDGEPSRRELADSLGGAARLLASEAMETLLSSRDERSLDRAAVRLREAAEAARVVAAFRESGALPDWADTLAPGTEGARVAAVVRRALQREAETGEPVSSLVFTPPKPPLTLSFSAISAYTRCPRCYYLNAIAGVGERPGTPLVFGNAVHRALRDFYVRWAEADSDGAAPDLRPGRELLLSLCDAALIDEWTGAFGEPPDRLTRDSAADQLSRLWDSLHSDRDHVEELEAWLPFTYRRDGHAHTINAKVDRLDRDPASGSVRLIDYKTGKANDGLTSPKPDDLQFGVYLLAIEAHRGRTDDAGQRPDPATFHAPTLRGTAEYWVLSTGERGVINLSDIDLAATRATIDAAIDGILAGNFSPARKCKGCEHFGDA